MVTHKFIRRFGIFPHPRLKLGLRPCAPFLRKKYGIILLTNRVVLLNEVHMYIIYLYSTVLEPPAMLGQYFFYYNFIYCILFYLFLFSFLAHILDEKNDFT